MLLLFTQILQFCVRFLLLRAAFIHKKTPSIYTVSCGIYAGLSYFNDKSNNDAFQADNIRLSTYRAARKIMLNMVNCTM